MNHGVLLLFAMFLAMTNSSSLDPAEYSALMRVYDELSECDRILYSCLSAPVAESSSFLDSVREMHSI
jgi:hypothetical protein